MNDKKNDNEVSADIHKKCPPNFFPILGVIITVIITNLLLNSEHPNFIKADVDAAINNFEYAYGYFRDNCPLKG